MRHRIAERVDLQSNILRNDEQLGTKRLRNEDVPHHEQDDVNGSVALTDGLAALKSFLTSPIRVKIARDGATGKSKGFGRVLFDSESSRNFALEALRMSELNGRELTVAITKKRADFSDDPRDKALQRDRDGDRYRPDKPRGGRDSNSIFVGNLAFGATADDVVNIISEVLGHSRISSVRLASDPYTGKAKGFGHVDLRSFEDCERAVNMMNGMSFLGRNIRVDYASNNAT